MTKNISDLTMDDGDIDSDIVVSDFKNSSFNGLNFLKPSN